MANEKYWSYQASERTLTFGELPAGAYAGTEDGWHSLSPGMRREIVRSFNKRQV